MYKSFLKLIVLMAMCIGLSPTIAHADTATFSTITTKEVASTIDASVSKTVDKATVTITKKSSNSPGFYTSTAYYRLYSTDLITFSVADGYVIESVVLTVSSNKHAVTLPDDVTQSGTSSPYTLTPKNPVQSFTLTGTGTCNYNKIEINYSAASPSDGKIQLGQPSIELNDEGKSFSIKDNDANGTNSKIYYCVNKSASATADDCKEEYSDAVLYETDYGTYYVHACAKPTDTGTYSNSDVVTKSYEVVDLSLKSFDIVFTSGWATGTPAKSVSAPSTATSYTYTVDDNLSIDCTWYQAYIISSKNLFLYGGSKSGYFVIPGFDDKKVTKIEVTTGTDGSSSGQYVVSGGDYTSDKKTTSSAGTVNVVDIPENYQGYNIAYKIAATGSNNSQLSKITVTYKPDESTCLRPVFGVTSGSTIDLNNQGDGVTLSCDTKGATIKYTITKDDVAGKEITYDGAIKFDAVGTYTITAHAELEGLNNSKEVTATYTVKVQSVANIAAWLQLASTEDEVAILNPVTVTAYAPDAAASSSYASLYVKDDSGYLLIYGTLKQLGNVTYTAGQKLSIKGLYKPYNKMPEMRTPTIEDVTGDAKPVAPAPDEIAYADIKADNAARYVSMKHLTYSLSNSNGVFTDQDGNTFGMYTQYYSKDNLEKGQVYNVVGAIYIDDDVVKLAPTSAPTVLPDAVTSESSNEGVIEAFFKHPIKFVAKNASKMIFKLGDADEQTVDVTNTTEFSLEYTPNTEAEEVSLTVTPVAADGDAWSARTTTFTLKLTKAPEPQTPVVTSNGEAVDGAYNIYRFTDITLTSENALSLGVKIGEDGTEEKVAIADNQFTYTPKFDNDEWPASFSLFVTPYDDVNDAYTTVEIKFTVVDRPSAVVTITPEAGAVDYNTEVTLKGDDNTVEIHYTVNDSEEQTYTKDSSIKLREATTITAWGINADKKAGEKATAEFTVGQPDSYFLVTSLDQLKDGANYVLVGNESKTYYVMSGGLNTSKGYYASTSLDSTYKFGDDITDTDVTFTKLVISKANDGSETAHYTLYDVAAKKYIGVASYATTAVDFKNYDSADEADISENKLAQFTIALDETAYTATITNGNTIRFNYNNNSIPRFKTYASSASLPLVYLYRQVEPAKAVTLTWSEASVEVPVNATEFTAPTLTVDTAEAASAVTYSSSDTNVATIDSEGNVSIKGEGETTITAAIASENKDYTAEAATYTLKVTEAVYTEVKLEWTATDAAVTLNATDNVFPTLSATPAEALTEVSYSSDNEDVATIDEKGVITLKADGRTTITAQIADSNIYKDAKASYTLTVKPEEPGEVTVDLSEASSYTDIVMPDDITLSDDETNSYIEDGMYATEGFTIAVVDAKNEIKGISKIEITCNEDYRFTSNDTKFSAKAKHLSADTEEQFDSDIINSDGGITWAAADDNDYISEFMLTSDMVGITGITITWDYIPAKVLDFKKTDKAISFKVRKGHKVSYRTIATPENSRVARRIDLISDSESTDESTTYGTTEYNEVVSGEGGWTVDTENNTYTCTLKSDSDSNVANLDNGDSYEIKVENGTKTYTTAAGLNADGDVVTGLDNVIVNAANGVDEWYTLQGIRVAHPAGGIFIHRVGNSFEKVVVK